MKSALPKVLGSWWFRVLVLGAWTIAAQRFLVPGMYFTGDEPHYMMAVVSFVKDADFNSFNNYAQKDYRLFGVHSLEPQWKAAVRPGLVPAEHGTLFPLILAPSYALRNMAGIRDFMALCALLACLLTAATIDLLVSSRLAGTAAAALLAISPTWQMHASRVYPEVIAGFMVALAFFLLALHVARPHRRTSALEVLTLGFLTLFLAVLYTKYVAFSLAIATTIFFLPRLRVRRELWVGAALAVAIAAANFLLWADQGAFWPGYDKDDKSPFAVAGWMQRYWRPWFDQYHGLFVFQPFTLLGLWAVFKYLRLPRAENQAIPAGLSVATLAYTAMHAFWLLGPGHCPPGRFFAALLPVICMLITIWAVQADRFKPLRWIAILAGVAIILVFVSESLKWNAPPYFVFRPWIESFDRYWPSWEPGSESQVKVVGAVGYLATAAILVTKGIAHALGLVHERRAGVPALSGRR